MPPRRNRDHISPPPRPEELVRVRVTADNVRVYDHETGRAVKVGGVALVRRKVLAGGGVVELEQEDGGKASKGRPEKPDAKGGKASKGRPGEDPDMADLLRKAQ